MIALPAFLSLSQRAGGHTGGSGLTFCAFLFLVLSGPALVVSFSADRVRLRSIGEDPATGLARAVVVEEGALVHTALMLPEDAQGRLQGDGDIDAQARRVLANIDLALKPARTSLTNLVRLHVYVADGSVTPEVDRLLRRRFRGNIRPAVTFVETAMPRPGVLVMMDAIAATGWRPDPGRPVRITTKALRQRTTRASHAALQPDGPFAIVSGRSASGDFEAAVRGTMEALRADLKAVDLTFDHVVQIKSFLADMGRAQQLEQVVSEFFGDSAVPPQVMTEWHQESAHVEIELIAMSSRPAGGQRVEYVEPVSGRFSRVVRVNSGRLVLTSGLYGASDAALEQVREMFAELQHLVKEAGSDMAHLVKATYYVADTGADQEFNAIRPTLYAPQRPPAASKLAVRGTGRKGKASTFDMIAVTLR
jgi:enamine deaminase RidA (YjgF/YER057c/UK114 family)